MAVSKYDKEYLSSEQQSSIDKLTKAAQSGSMSWADAHSAAEKIRASAGYSGGQYGDEYKTGSGSGSSGSGGSKSGNSVYDQLYFSADELQQADAIRNAARSGQTSWDAAHNYVENLRKNYGYSGGQYGNEYNPIAQDAYAQRLEELQAQLEALASEKPSYSGDPYDTSGVIDQLTNMDYADWTQSDQYKALADRYGIQGQMSMQDVLGQISSRTGGLASSYATTAAQQQYNEYMSQLEEVARQMYSSDRSDLAENLSVLNSANDTAYNRYLDELGQYNTDYSNAYGAYRDAVGDVKYNQEYTDSRSDYADSQAATSKADAQNRINAYLAAYGAVKDLDADLVSASGYTQSELNTLEKYYADQKAQEQAAALKSSSSGSGSKSSSKSSGSGSGSGSSKPTLTAAQTLNALENGIVNDTTRAAYEYYYGQPYDDGGTEGGGSVPSFSNYSEAVAYMKENGVPNGNASGAMTQSEWARHKNSYQQSGQGGTEVTEYDSYADYLTAYVQYCIESYGEK